VIGGGAIGCELSQVLSEFGVRVTVLEVADRLLALEEPEASAALEKAFAAAGIQVLTGISIDAVSYADGQFRVSLEGQEIVADKLLVCAGRRLNLAGLGLETIGLDPDARSLDPDEWMRVADGVYAVGDITGKGAFTHMSMYQGALVVDHLLGRQRPGADYRAAARVTFTTPEVASVGMSEKAARDAGLDVVVASGDLGSRGWIARDDGLVKIVVDADRRVLVGATVVGSVGGEVMSVLALAVHAEVPLDTFLLMHFAYPTFHRAVETVLEDAAQQLGGR
jgi:pyruvate/2-oxoglutarate dehydrogenase complex dihydrolipoamide dehydrogenase (E3) component